MATASDLLTTHRMTHVFSANTQNTSEDWMLSVVYFNGNDPINPLLTKVMMQTQFIRKSDNAFQPAGSQQLVTHLLDDVIVAPNPPVNSSAKFIKTSSSLGLESIACNLRPATNGGLCIEAQVNGAIALLSGRAAAEMNRYAMANPSASTHELFFLQMAERRLMAPGDIILLYNKHSSAPRNAELVMAIAISLAKEGLARDYAACWHTTMSYMHNKLLSIWAQVNRPSAPHTYLKALQDRPICIPLIPEDQIAAKYFNVCLNRAKAPKPLGSSAAPTPPDDAAATGQGAAKKARVE